MHRQSSFKVLIILLKSNHSSTNFSHVFLLKIVRLHNDFNCRQKHLPFSMLIYSTARWYFHPRRQDCIHAQVPNFNKENGFFKFHGSTHRKPIWAKIKWCKKLPRTSPIFFFFQQSRRKSVKSPTHFSLIFEQWQVL